MSTLSIMHRGALRRLPNLRWRTRSWAQLAGSLSAALSDAAFPSTRPTAPNVSPTAKTKETVATTSASRSRTNLQSQAILSERTRELVKSPVPGTENAVVSQGWELIRATKDGNHRLARELYQDTLARDLMRYSWIQEAVCLYFCNLKQETAADNLLHGVESEGIRPQDVVWTAWLHLKVQLGKVNEVAEKLKIILAQSYRPSASLAIVAIPPLVKQGYLRLAEELLDSLLLQASSRDRPYDYCFLLRLLFNVSRLTFFVGRIPANAILFEYFWKDQVEDGERMLVKLQKAGRPLEMRRKEEPASEC